MISALLIVCTLIGLLPVVTFAATEEKTTRAAADLTSQIDALAAPKAQTNTFQSAISDDDKKIGKLEGTYYLVIKDSSNQYYAMDPLPPTSKSAVAAKAVTVSGSSVSGADPSMAIDLVWQSNNTYHLATSDGRRVREYIQDNVPYFIVSSTTQTGYALGFNYINSANATLRLYRNFGGTIGYQNISYTNGTFTWIAHEGGYAPEESILLYKVAQRWDTSPLYNAIKAMRSYASANDGRFAPLVHEAFMDCMEKSIALYNKHNVATTTQTYDQVVAIRSELKAQTQQLLSYEAVLQASYSDAAANVPTPRNTFVPITWGDWTANRMNLLAGKTYFIVNRNTAGTGGYLLDATQDCYTNDLMAAQPVTIEDGQVLNADPNWGITFQNGSNLSCTILDPIQGLNIGLETTAEGSSFHKIVYSGASRDVEITPFIDGLYLNVHPGGKDSDNDGRNDRYAITYIPADNGFRYLLDLDEAQTANNTMYLYELSTYVIDLYKAIIRLAPFATGNENGRYPADTYNSFLTCLTDSVKTYLQYNVNLNTTDKANFTAVKKSIDDQTTALKSYLTTLTRQDTITEFIDIPVEIYDFRADGLLFEYLHQHYNLASVRPGSSLTPPGDWSDHGRINLTTGELLNRKLVYKDEVITFVAESMCDEETLGDIHADGYAPGWNDVFYNMLHTGGSPTLRKGSLTDTFKDTSTGANGGELSWSKVDSYFDLAYYLLTYLWRPVDPDDIVDTQKNLPYNVTIPERDRLRLYADENGNYLLDADNDVVYDGYYVYNPTPRAQEDITYDSALFTPADGLGFETPELMEKIGDTDRGDLNEGWGFETENTNFHFSMHAYGSFVYYEDQNQYFDFLGDDDVYFFIDGKLVLDIGGAHAARGGRVELKDLAAKYGWTDDTVYDFDMFYAERHTTASNLRFSTNIKIVDTETLTTMGQYAQTYNGSPKLDSETGLGQELVDNGAVFVNDTIAYSYDLTNTRNVPVYDISFVCPMVGSNISSTSLTLYNPNLTNEAVTNIGDITVYYRVLTQTADGEDVLDSSVPIIKTYDEMHTLLNTAITANKTLPVGSYRVEIETEDQLKNLLLLGIPHNCQISVYGFKRNTTANDTPFTNTVSSHCYYKRAASNEGSADGEIFELDGIASRKLRVSAGLPSIVSQKIVLDYGKPVQIPVNAIAEQIYTDSFVTVSGFAGITLSGSHNEVAKKVPTGLTCKTVGSTFSTNSGIFTRTSSGLEYRLTDFFDEVETVYLVYSLDGCELSDIDGSVTKYPYMLVQLQLIPATSVYYETDFAHNVFDLSTDPGELFFDFTDDEDAQERYSAAKYGGFNFDRETNGYWGTRATRVNENAPTDFSIDNEAGTLSINVADGLPETTNAYYGPWFLTSNTYGQYPGNNSTATHPLRYAPSEAEVIQVRFKVTDCSVVPSKNPEVVFVYHYMKDGALKAYDYTMKKDYTFRKDVYQTVTIPVNETFRTADAITTVGFRFWDLQSNKGANGKVVIDYIYIGPEDKIPATDNIYIDFTNTPDDRERYSNPVYCGINPDNATKPTELWAQPSVSSSVTINNTSGTMQIVGKTLDANAWPGYYTYLKSPLNFSPENADYFEIRFKLENFVEGTQGTAIKKPYFTFGCYENISSSATTVIDGYNYDKAHIADGEWITIRQDISNVAALKKLKKIESLRLYFGGIESDLTKFSSLGKITIDYVYVGPRKVFFDFTDTPEERVRYVNPTYGNLNFDEIGSWYRASAFQSVVIDPENEGTLKMTLPDDDGYWHCIHTGTSSTSYPMKFRPEDNDIFKIRFKLDNAAMWDSSAPDKFRLGFYFRVDGIADNKYDYRNLLLKDYNNKGYCTFEIKLNGCQAYKDAELITAIRPYFMTKSASGTNASLTIDYIYIGPAEHAPDDAARQEEQEAKKTAQTPANPYLFFDFKNSEYDRKRYQNPAYGGYNFDEKQWITANSTGALGYSFDYASGTVSIPVTNRTSDYGPYFATTNNLSAYPYGGHAKYAPLSHTMTGEEILRIRFKVEDCTVVSATKAKLGALLHSTISGTPQYVSSPYTKEYEYVDGKDMEFEFDLSSKYQSGDILNSVGFRFYNLNSSAGGKITIDYIYVGQKSDFAKVKAENTQLWQTVSDGSAQNEYQDVDMATEEAAAATYTSTTSAASAQTDKSKTERSAVRSLPSSLALPSGMTMNSRNDYKIMDGVTETNMMLTHNGEPLAVYVTTIEANAKASMKASYTGYYTKGSSKDSRAENAHSLPCAVSTTTQQAAAYEAATGEKVIFAMNGGFSDAMYKQRSVLILEGNLIQGHFGTIQNEPVFAIMKDGSYAFLDYSDDLSQVENGFSARQWLIKDGKNVTASLPTTDTGEKELIENTHPRTAVGLTAEGDLVCIVLDGRQPGYSTYGLVLNDLANLMLSMGCVSAANMDGGWSSTFATVRNGSKLTIRNIPSNASNPGIERDVGSTLLLISTEHHCQHTYDKKDYRQLSGGKHELLCDLCRQGISSEHRYTNGVCVCGKAEEVPNYLFFDFANNDAALARYNSPVYGYRNYDLPSYSNWWRGFWSTQAADSDGNNTYRNFNVDSEKGVLKVRVADYTGPDDTGTLANPVLPLSHNNAHGPWILTSPVYYRRISPTNADGLALKYDPANAEVAEVRFKLENCAAVRTKPRVVLIYDYEKDGVMGSRDYSMVPTYEFDDANGKYYTVKFPLNTTFKGADSIQTIGFRFYDIYSTELETITVDGVEVQNQNQGSVVIDYIYVGPDTNRPGEVETSSEFFIDFTNTKSDQRRYTSHTYGGFNFDLTESWTNSKYFNKVAISDGVMTLTPKDNTIRYGYAATGKTLDCMPLNYSPNADDYLQVRFKVEDAVAANVYANKTGIGRFALYYAAVGEGQVATPDHYVYCDYTVTDITNQGWITLTYKLSEMPSNHVNITEYQTIHSIAPCFNWFKSAEGKTATFQIDYIYMGPEDGLPSFDRPTYGYDSTYENDAKLSNGSSLFIEGNGIPKYSADKKPIYEAGKKHTATGFTFTGTGFDIISRTGANQGLIRVSVYDATGAHVKTAQVLNKSENNLELYQIPVLSIEGLTHGTYSARIFVADAYDYGNDCNDDTYGGALDRGGEFYFDAIRIHNPINTKAVTEDAQIAKAIYARDAEADSVVKEVREMLITAKSFSAGGDMEGVVYLDASADSEKTAIANYTAVGPNNETYLAPGNAIAFKLEAIGALPASIDVGVKSADGTTASMLIGINKYRPATKPTGTAVSVSTSTSQYHPINILPSAWNTTSSSAGIPYIYITVYNSGSSGILSVTDFKYAYDISSAEPAARSAARYVRFVVDQEMIDVMNACYEHDFSYCALENGHEAVCTLCNYKELQSHSYTDGVCICGANEAKAPIFAEDLSFTMNITAGAEMVVNYSIVSAAVSNYSDFYLEVKKAVADGEPIVTTYGIGENRTAMGIVNHPETGEPILYNASYNGINAKEMGDTFETTLYAIDTNGRVCKGETIVSSIKDYLMAKLDDAKSSSELKTMAVDMLRYGEAAQHHFTYATENLVTNELTEEHLAYATKELPEAVNYQQISGNGANVNTSIMVGSKVELSLSTIVRDVADPGAVKCVITDEDGKVLAELATSCLANAMFSAKYDNVGAREMRKMICATFYDANGNAISKTLHWSIESYVAQTRTNAKAGETEIALVDAMLVYGDSVAAYLDANGL